MPFTTTNKVRVHDTDLAGILYFPRIFRFVNEALEDMMESDGYSFQRVFHELDFLFVTVHAEADYHNPVMVGDHLHVYVAVERIGTSSFTFLFEIYKKDKTHVGSAKTIHVTLERKSRKKVPIPDVLHNLLAKHLVKEPG